MTGLAVLTLNMRFHWNAPVLQSALFGPRRCRPKRHTSGRVHGCDAATPNGYSRKLCLRRKPFFKLTSAPSNAVPRASEVVDYLRSHDGGVLIPTDANSSCRWPAGGAGGGRPQAGDAAISQHHLPRLPRFPSDDRGAALRVSLRPAET